MALDDGTVTTFSRRRTVGSGGPWEERAGYSRAVAVGERCWVAGTTDAGPDGRSQHPLDAGAQARAAFTKIDTALAAAGFERADVVRTRLFVVGAANVEAVLAVHGEVFREIRPAATLVLVAGLIEPSLLVEIEVDACR